MSQFRRFLSFETAEAAARAAAAFVAWSLISADARRRAPRLAIAGGSAAGAMQHVLAALPDEVRKRLRLTWADERCVPLADRESNRGAAERAGLLPGDNAVTLPLWWDDATVDAAIARVTAGLRDDFADGLDVALLGMGEDGHVASLFPGHAALALTQPVAHITDSPKPPPARMTLTLPILRGAGERVILATGEGKRDALQRLHRGASNLPAAALMRLTVFTDLELEDEPDDTNQAV